MQTTNDNPTSQTTELKGIESNYMESFFFLQNRKLRQVNQLVLLNNLERGDKNIASTLLLTLFDRLLSNLYDDKIQVKFVPSEEIDQKRINSLNLLAQSDYKEMNKAKLDYDWMWDTLFFGRGYMETLQFDKKKKILKPHVINPLVFGYDPYFENVQDWRYYWKWITKSKYEINKLIKAGFITGISDASELPSGIDPYLWQYKIKRDKAKKAVAPPISPAGNDVYQILEYFGYNENGKKCVKWIDKNFSKVLMYEELDLRDSDDGKDSKWPIVVKEAFREPHSSITFSVADLLEDKHRAKSVLLNLAFIAAKDRANPIYGYNPDKVKDLTQFFSRQIDQHIPMEGPDAVWPINTADPMSAGLLNFISVLTTEANEPIGTGMTGQPQKSKSSQTATETAITQQLNDMAQSLQSKVLQFGEEEFWGHWFNRYKRYAKEADSKMAAIIGVKGTTFEKVDLKDISTMALPGVMVFSAKEAEYKELVLRRDLMELYPQLAQTLDPDGLRNFNKHIFFPKFLQDPSLVDIMLPSTLDEMKAEQENEQLKEDILADVSETDDHTAHIYTHYQVIPKTWATWIHIEWHQRLLAQQKQQKMQQEQMMMQQQVATPASEISKEKRSPIAQASPLKSEIKTNQNIVK